MPTKLPKRIWLAWAAIALVLFQVAPRLVPERQRTCFVDTEALYDPVVFRLSENKIGSAEPDVMMTLAGLDNAQTVSINGYEHRLWQRDSYSIQASFRNERLVQANILSDQCGVAIHEERIGVRNPELGLLDEASNRK